MPKLDKTGPMGQGPMTGRGMGCCGCRGGLFGRMFYTNEERNELLKDREIMLENELKAVKEELTKKKDQ